MMNFQEILHNVNSQLEERAFDLSHTEKELVGCEKLYVVVKIINVMSCGGILILTVERKDGTTEVVFTDKSDRNYFSKFMGKTVFISGLTKYLDKTMMNQWFIRTCKDVTDQEESLTNSDKFSEEEKLLFQRSIERFPIDIQRDLGKKMVAVADKVHQEDTEERVKTLYREIEELNALYEVLKPVIPLEFRQSYEEARYRSSRKCADSEKRNYIKQMAEILDWDWISNAEYEQIDIDAIKTGMEKVHIGHHKQLDEIFTELKASNISKRAAKTLNFIGRPGTGINVLAEELAKASGRGYSIINLGGEHLKESESLTGTSKIYENARCGLIYEHIKKAGSRGILIIKDFDLYDAEIKKILFPLIKKTSFLDKFMEVKIDLSDLFVIVTCSTIKDIPISTRAHMTSIYFQDLQEDEMVEMINKILAPKYCAEFGLTFTKDIPKAACRKLIYKFSNMDMNKLDSMIRAIVVKTITKGKNEFPDFNVEDIDSFVVSTEDYEQIRNTCVREITAVENKFFNCYDEYPFCVQTNVVERFEILNWGSDEKQKEHARDCVHYLANIFHMEEQPFEIGSIVKELRKTHYLQNNFGERIEAAILAKKLENTTKKMTIIGLKGGAGTGKSSTAKSIASALGRNCVKVNVGGCGGAEIIKGSNKSVHNAGPSMIIKELSKSGHGSYSDVLILDEIDKGVPDFYNALYEFLDPNEEYLYDQYLECHIPKNNFIVICTFNDVSCIPLPIRDRMEIVEYSNYSIQDKKVIITNYILPKLREKFMIRSLEVETEALEVYVNDYAIMPGMREVERDFEYILMKMASVKNGSFDHEVINLAHITETLGIKRSVGLNDVPPLSLGKYGMAQALAVTSGGIGVSTAVETVINPYQDKNIVVTGQLEGSCLESVSLACCFASQYMKKELPKLHIHMTDAVKKDGPSAGVAITMSIISCLLENPLPNVAFTGSIDLYGNIGPVGGVFEKCIAAERSLAEKVYVPLECYKTLTERKQLERLKVKVVPVDTMKELIELVWGMEV